MVKNRTWSFDWRKSPPHLALLTTFLIPTLLGQYPPEINWLFVLGETPEKAVERFFIQGAIRYYPANNEILNEFTVEQLKVFLRSINLKVTGLKEELILRLQEGNFRLVGCTEYGRKYAEQYLANPEEAPDVGWSEKDIKFLLRWFLVTVAGGVIGNTAYDILKSAFDSLKERSNLEEELPPAPTPTPAPDFYLAESELRAMERTEPLGELSILLKEDALFNEGLKLQKEGKNWEAIKMYNDAIELIPLARTYNNRGVAFEKLRRYHEAIKDYNDAIRLDPSQEKTFYNRGDLYLKRRDPRRAINDFNNALKLNREHAQAYRGRGQAYEKINDTRRAINDYKSAIRFGDKVAKNLLRNLENRLKQNR